MNARAGRLKPGDTFVVRRHVSAHLVRMFGELIGDLGERHLPAGDRVPIAHGFYLAAFVSMFAPGMDLVGHRAEFTFHGAARVGDTVTATVTVRSVRPAGAFGDWADVGLEYRNQNGELLVEGAIDLLSTPRARPREREALNDQS
ncbi:hypothetical protein ACFXAF_00680 [Kitasatospora sp. NPDC059463]|uniref:hypothetical protein n=1 Tax=unclassified Kitasatospora TaxID=2633591 RepID=UPI0036978B95